MLVAKILSAVPASKVVRILADEWFRAVRTFLDISRNLRVRTRELDSAGLAEFYAVGVLHPAVLADNQKWNTLF